VVETSRKETMQEKVKPTQEWQKCTKCGKELSMPYDIYGRTICEDCVAETQMPVTNILKEAQKNFRFSKEQTTTIADTTDLSAYWTERQRIADENRHKYTYDHILWLAKLSYDQLEIIKELVKNFFNKDWWFNVSSRNARETLMSYADRIDNVK